MGHTHKYKFKFLKKNQVKSPGIMVSQLELGSDPVIGSSRESGCDTMYLRKGVECW